MSSQPMDPRSTTGAQGVAGRLAAVRREVRGLASTLWAARDRGELMDAVAEVEALKSTLDALELAMVRELDATHAAKEAGWASTQDYLTSVAGGHKGTGPATVRLAKAIEEPVLAPVGEALTDGWLSTTKAQVIERAIDTLPGDPDLRAPRGPGAAGRGQSTRRHRAAQAHPPPAHPGRPRGSGPPRRTRARPPRTRRPPQPTPHHHRRPVRRSLDQRPLQHRGRRPHQSHPDPTRRTPPQPWTRLRPRHLRDPRLWPSTAATPATTASGCSTPSSRAADDSRPPTCSPSPTAPPRA